MKRIFIACGLLSHSIYGSVLPPNNLDLQDQVSVSPSGVTEEEFGKIGQEIFNYYAPIVKQHGAELQIIRSWASPTVNAFAEQKKGKWKVMIYGGLARRAEVDFDSLNLAICHELGHHLGGFPLRDNTWSAVEGQADYFATQACIRNVWKHHTELNAKYREVVEDLPRRSCDTAWSGTADRDLCYRVSVASKRLATLLAAINPNPQPAPKFETPDLHEVSTTNKMHPNAQCRLDTLMNGALCGVKFADNLIPGRAHPTGQASSRAEIEASLHSCTEASLFETAYRPRCWFKPHVGLLASIHDQRWNEISGDHDDIVEPGESWAVNPEIRNDGFKPFPDVEAIISSSSPELILGVSNRSLGDLSPAQKRQASNGFEVTLDPDTPCGTALHYALDVSSGKHKISSNYKFYAGKQDIFPAGEKAENKQVIGYQTVTIPIEVKDTPDVQKLHFSMDLEASSPQRFTVTLTSPSGETFALMTPPGLAALPRYYEFDLTQSDVNGTWNLVLQNDGIARGTLISWKLDFSDYTCN
jgi:subtilisin-like proprotein convertase family protein